MAQFFNQPIPQGQPSPYGAPSNSAQNLQFYPSSYTPGPVSGHATPAQAGYGYGAPGGGQAYGAGYGGGFGAAPGVSGRMGEQGGLRTGWLAAFGTEGYEGEPPLLEELGVNFGHIQSKVFRPLYTFSRHILTRYTDISGPQPPRPHRPAYNGRLRPRRSNPLFPALRDLPFVLRQSPFRLHLWPGTARLHLVTHNPLLDVSASRPSYYA